MYDREMLEGLITDHSCRLRKDSNLGTKYSLLAKCAPLAEGCHFLQIKPASSKKEMFDLLLYVPVNNFSVMSGWVFLG